jgi:hypothetical protein
MSWTLSIVENYSLWTPSLGAGAQTRQLVPYFLIKKNKTEEITEYFKCEGLEQFWSSYVFQYKDPQL